ncbi:MAG: hypothetical protein ACNS62_14210 [Candidatus Cyclobacteriaceae bacterium M3_2C_046]
MDLYQKVEENQAFKVKDGPTIFSVKELYDVVKEDSIPVDLFMYHAGQNDFARWISHVYEDQKLAKGLTEVKTKKIFLERLELALKIKNF